MSSFDNISAGGDRRRLPTVPKYLYPSYLKRVAQAPVYSSIDLTKMLAPKTYEVRRTAVTDNGRRFLTSRLPSTPEEPFGNARNVDRVESELNTTNDEAIEVYKKCYRAVQGQNTNGPFVGNTDYRQTCADESYRVITKTKITDDETAKLKNIPVIVPTDIGRHSKDINDDSSGSPCLKSNDNGVLYDRDSQEQNRNYSNRQPGAPSQGAYGVEIVKKCNKCDKVYPLTVHEWNEISEHDKNKLLQEIAHISLTKSADPTNNLESTSQLMSTNNWHYDTNNTHSDLNISP